MRHCCWFLKILCRFSPLWQDLDTDLMVYFADLESVAFSFIQGQVAQSTKIVATSNRQGFPPPLRHQRHLRWHTPSKNVQMVSGKYEKKDKVLLTFLNLHLQMCVLFAWILRLFQQLVTLWIQHLKVTLVLILLPSQVLLKELLDKSVERILGSIFIGI